MVSGSSEEAMKVHIHTKFCLLCVVTFLFHQCSHCHGEGHHHHGHDHDHDRNRAHDHNDLQISQAPYMPPRQGEAESEQRFYILQLFRRYGQRDRLDFGGFQSLLLSLGLGEVKVVGLDHEELGHDHVAHLDLLEVQEGLHSHSPSHPHPQPHAHPHPHPHTEQEESWTASSPCKLKAAGANADPTATPAIEGSRLEDRDHDHGDGGHKEKQPHHHDHHHKHPHMHHHHKHNSTASQQAQLQDAMGQELLKQPEQSGQPDQKEQLPRHPAQTEQLEQPVHSVQPEDTAQSGQPEDTAQSGQLEDTAQLGQPENTVQSEQPEQPMQSGQPEEPVRSGQLEQPSEAAPPQNSRPKRPRRPSKGKVVRNKNRGGPTPTPSPSPPGDYGNVRRAMEDQDGNKNPLNDHQEPPQGQGHEHSYNHDHGDGHAHVRRREAPESPVNLASTVPATHPNNMEHQHEECLNLTQLFHYYGLNSDSLISHTTFTYLCPALLYQIDSRVCIRHYHQVDIAHADPEPDHPARIWVFGFVSITIISLLSLLGLALVPILKQSCFKFLLTFLVALAVGTLSGDALLHLLPHSQGEHDHSHDPANPAPVKDLLTKFDGVWKGLTALAGIYLLFIIEHCIGMFKHYKDQGGTLCRKRRKGEEAKIGRKLSDHKLNRRSDAEWLHLKPLTADGADSSMLSCDNKHNDTQLTELQDPDSPSKKPLAPADPEHDHQGADSPATENGRKAKTKRHGHGHSHGHSHGHDHCHSDQEMKDAGIASIAWMVIMGDGMHNFSDGLAIGAAFSDNVTGGISTSVAVFCHEFPHELGDFAVLLKAGMSVKQAILYNLLSAVMAYVGMLIGTAVGQYTHNVTSWIFAITAGMFLYVALVDMLPEMLHGDSEDHKRCQFGHFLLQNMGLLTGFGIMLLIAIFEDRIALDFGF